MITTVNTYVFRALDAYPYDLETAIEALDLALAYDDRNVIALRLMGLIHSEVLNEYDVAIDYFEKVLAEDPNNIKVQNPYFFALLWNDDLDKAMEFIGYALTVKGCSKGQLIVNKALVLEQKEAYEEALELLNTAPRYIYNEEYLSYCKEVKERIKKKNFIASKETKKDSDEPNTKEESEPAKSKRFGFLF